VFIERLRQPTNVFIAIHNLLAIVLFK